MNRRLFIVLAWLVTTLWLPATLHCAIETAGWFDLTDCCSGDAAVPAAGGHEELNHCATLESGVPREELNAPVLSVPVVVQIETLRPAFMADTAAANRVTPWRAAPPEIGGMWRATHRVVAAAQAP